MGRKNKRKHEKVRPIHASKYISNRNSRGNTSRSKTGIGNTSRSNTGIGISEGNVYELTNSSQYNPRPRRGDIWFARLGNHYDTSVQSGTRPVFIISNDTGNRFSKTYTVLPMTSRMKKPDLPTHVELTASSCVLTADTELEDSMLLAEQVVTIDKSALLEKIAFVSDGAKLTEIERAVRIHLGIAGKGS